MIVWLRYFISVYIHISGRSDPSNSQDSRSQTIRKSWDGTYGRFDNSTCSTCVHIYMYIYIIYIYLECTSVNSVLEITSSNWPFYEQFASLSGQNCICPAGYIV